FQLVSYGVEKAVLLFIAPHLTDQEDGVQHHSRDDETKNDNTQDQRNNFAPAKNDPTDVERNRQAHQASAQRNEKSNRLGATGDAHGVTGKIVDDTCRPRTEVGWKRS